MEAEKARIIAELNNKLRDQMGMEKVKIQAKKVTAMTTPPTDEIRVIKKKSTR
jgi:hypothetical protein